MRLFLVGILATACNVPLAALNEKPLTLSARATSTGCAVRGSLHPASQSASTGGVSVFVNGIKLSLVTDGVPESTQYNRNLTGQRVPASGLSFDSQTSKELLTNELEIELRDASGSIRVRSINPCMLDGFEVAPDVGSPVKPGQVVSLRAHPRANWGAAPITFEVDGYSVSAAVTDGVVSFVVPPFQRAAVVLVTTTQHPEPPLVESCEGAGSCVWKTDDQPNGRNLQLRVVP